SVPPVPPVKKVKAVKPVTSSKPKLPAGPAPGVLAAAAAPPMPTPEATIDPAVAAATVGTTSIGVPPGTIIPIPEGINKGLSSAKNATMIQTLGMPRDSIDSKCRGVTNSPLKQLIVTRDVGPFRVTGVRVAVESLARVMVEVKKHEPSTVASLGSVGMLCVRFIKGTKKLSNHSWGCAIDISIDGRLDGLPKSERRDGKTLAGLAAMAPFFHAEGWYWGVGFSKFEDGMHFEVADETIRKWHADGTLGKRAGKRKLMPSNLSIGDNGAEVAALQRALAEQGFDIIPDGDFGPITHGIVMDFQAEEGLVPDGIVGATTKKALGL
ncbi:M15 family metallopeptidase, partial [Amylibacter sp.]|nr:M15 family metallopeptidase [Amylibacter sp.]